MENQFLIKTKKPMTVRFTYPIKSGVYFYEVELYSYGHMRFGWTTKEVRLTAEEGIGEDVHSIGFEISRNVILHNKKKTDSKNLSLRPGSIVGCLIDVNNKRFIFYLNGQEIECQEKIYFSKQPYFLSASLSAEQKCDFNLGQKSFEHAPKQDFKKFALNLNEYKSEYDYRLIEGKATKQNHYWFEHKILYNCVDLFYHDDVQRKHEQLVRQLQEDVNHSRRVNVQYFDSIECLRFIQAVIEAMQCKLNDHSYIWARLHKELNKFDNGDHCNYFQAKLFEFIYPYIHLQVDIENTIKCHNVCIVSMAILHTIGSELPPEFPYKMFYLFKNNNFVNIKTFFKDPQLMLNALISFDQVCFEEDDKNQMIGDNEIMSTLAWCVDLFGQVSTLTKLYDPKFDFAKLHAGFCCGWFLINFLAPHKPQLEQSDGEEKILNPSDASEMLKLSQDMYSARNDSTKWQSVRATCSYPNIDYFEVILMSSGPMRIGWATNETNLNNTKIGDDKHSIAYNGYSDSGNVYHDAQICNSEQSVSPWRASNVIGCFIDKKTKQFEFYQNGIQILYQKQFKISSNVYFPAVSLSVHQQCYFNFGQKKFKFPKHPNYNKFNKETQNSVELTEISYEFVPSMFVEDTVELFFSDVKQKEIARLVEEMETDILSGLFIENINTNEEPIEIVTSPKLPPRETSKLKKPKEKDSLRIIQSMIEVLGEKSVQSEVYKIDVLAYVIADLIRFSTKKDNTFPDLVCKMLYPYFKLKIDHETIRKHRNVCIVLSIIIVEIQNFKTRVNLYKQIKAYLIEIIIQCENFCDMWTLVFAFTCLEHLFLKNVDEYCINTSKMNKFVENLLRECETDLRSKHLPNDQRALLHQTLFCCRRFYFVVLGNNKSETENKKHLLALTNYSVLHQEYENNYLKLSPDRLTVRNNSNTHSIRSVDAACRGIYYYEAKLLTSGPMRIGWRTDDVELETIGYDEYSIGIDGYNRCVWHEKKCYPFINNLKQWEAGNVIGCLFDVDNRKFSFYIDGTLVEYPHEESPIIVSKKIMYNAAISLADYQQCCFNFGQVRFERKPSGLGNATFFQDNQQKASSLQYNEYSMSPNITYIKNIDNSITNSIIPVGSTVEIGDVNMRSQKN